MEETKKQENKPKKKLSVDSTMLLTIGAALGIIVLVGIVYFIFKIFQYENNKKIDKRILVNVKFY